MGVVVSAGSARSPAENDVFRGFVPLAVKRDPALGAETVKLEWIDDSTLQVRYAGVLRPTYRVVQDGYIEIVYEKFEGLEFHARTQEEDGSAAKPDGRP